MGPNVHSLQRSSGAHDCKYLILPEADRFLRSSPFLSVTFCRSVRPLHLLLLRLCNRRSRPFARVLRRVRSCGIVVAASSRSAVSQWTSERDGSRGWARRGTRGRRTRGGSPSAHRLRCVTSHRVPPPQMLLRVSQLPRDIPGPPRTAGQESAVNIPGWS